MWFVSVYVLMTLFSATFCEECMTLNIDDDFDLLSSGTACGIMPTWIQQNYSSTNIESNDDRSLTFITPREAISCLTTGTFTMNKDGIVQANVYMIPRLFTDYILIIAYESTGTIVGQVTSSLSVSNFVYGWNTLNVVVTGEDSFEGYVGIVGRAASNSHVLLDSLQYIPPSIEIDNVEQHCPIYEEENNEGDSEEQNTSEEDSNEGDDEGYNTSEEEEVDEDDEVDDEEGEIDVEEDNNENDNEDNDENNSEEDNNENDNEDNNENNSEEDNQDDNEELEEEIYDANCIEYDFEENFQNLFNMNYFLCTTFNSWVIADSTETSFILANDPSSCTSSLYFNIETSGVLEIEVYMMPVAARESIAILVNDDAGIPIGETDYIQTSPDFTLGWKTLSIPLNINEPKDVHIVFIGWTSPGAIVLINSFKFVSSLYTGDGGSCTPFANAVLTT